MPLTQASPDSLGVVDPSGVAPENAALDLPTLCDVYSKRLVADGGGGFLAQYDLAEAGVHCRIRSVDEEHKAFHGGKILAVQEAKADFALNAPILTTSRIVVGDAHWDVRGFDQGVSDPIYLTARLMRVF